MRLVLGTHHFSSLGGSETYLLSVAEQLERLGHELTIFAIEVGEMADLARERGLAVSHGASSLPDTCDGILSQDAVSALLLAERYPQRPLVFVVHGAGRDLMVPPQLPGAVSAAVVMNDRVAERVRSMARDHDVVRLRQPIDPDRFTSRMPIRDPARRLLLLGNNLRGPRREMVASVCAELGLECVQVGRHGAADSRPEVAINQADIVMGYGRSALEGMACGRAVYVLDHLGGDGWVTAESYPRLEADGFGGRACPGVIDRARLTEDLSAYTAGMGMVNRDLVAHEHDANRHAQKISQLFKRLEPRPPLPAPLTEMARLVRLQWQSDSRAGMLALENGLMAERLEAERRSAEQLQAELQTANGEVWAELDRTRRVLADVKASRRYRLAGMLAAPLEALRSRRGRRAG